MKCVASIVFLLASGLTASAQEESGTVTDWTKKKVQQYLYDAGRDFFFWFWDKAQELGETMLMGVLEQVIAWKPDLAPQFSAVSGVLAQIDFFFPLTETLGLASMLLTTWQMVKTFRAVVSWLPGR